MENVIEPDARRTLERAHVHFLVHSHAMLLRLRFSFVHTLLDAGLRSSTVHGIQQHSTLLVPQDPEVDPIIPVPSAFGSGWSSRSTISGLATAFNTQSMPSRKAQPTVLTRWLQHDTANFESIASWDFDQRGSRSGISIFIFDKIHRHSSKV